ncbi:MAG: hypothetical protein EBR30_24725, partial [Cytophagia bacterium]|nr:hypothetical protein [Cytophagia bacterium]
GVAQLAERRRRHAGGDRRRAVDHHRDRHPRRPVERALHLDGQQRLGGVLRPVDDQRDVLVVARVEGVADDRDGPGEGDGVGEDYGL